MLTFGRGIGYLQPLKRPLLLTLVGRHHCDFLPRRHNLLYDAQWINNATKSLATFVVDVSKRVERPFEAEGVPHVLPGRPYYSSGLVACSLA